MHLIDPDSSVWSDETTEDKTIEWEILKKKVTLSLPYLEPKEFSYDGRAHKPALKNHDSINIDNWSKVINGYYSNLLIDGDNSDHINFKTKSDTYTETVGLAESVYISDDSSRRSANIVEFQWEDGRKDPIELEWSIKKSLLPPPTISLENFDYDGLSHSVLILW